MTNPASHPLLPYCPSSLAEQLLTGRQRILLYGEAGIGKSTLTNELALELSGKNQTCFCITADPGSPGFGLPGTVSQGQWQGSIWQVLAFEALGTLDAGRFRLLLITHPNSPSSQRCFHQSCLYSSYWRFSVAITLPTRQLSKLPTFRTAA